MKKSLFMMGVAIAALSSCTQNEVLDIAESNTIQFGKSYIGKPTRANIINNEEELDNFYVYGFTKTASGKWGNGTETSGDGQYLFDNEKVYKDGDVWKYDNIKKYQKDYSYTFAAYSDGGNTNVTGKLESLPAEDEGTGTGVKYEVVAAVTEEPTSPETVKLTIQNYSTTENNDLLVSISTSKLTESNQQVSFGFKHALAQIKFTINNPLGNNPIEVTNFKVTGFNEKATLTLTSPTESVVPTMAWETPSESKTIEEANAVVAEVGTPAEYIYTLIPQDKKQLTVSLTATLHKTAENGGGTETKNYEITINEENIPQNYEAGYIYNFKMTLNMGYIYFDGITVDQWKTGDELEVVPTEKVGA